MIPSAEVISASDGIAFRCSAWQKRFDPLRDRVGCGGTGSSAAGAMGAVQRLKRGMSIGMSGEKLPATFRTPIILLAVVDLAVLGRRLWPWGDAMGLPGDGTTVVDPVISLIGYIALAWWVGNARTAPARRELFASGIVGLFGGLLMAAQVYFSVQPLEAAEPLSLQYGLLAGAIVLWVFSAIRTRRHGHALDG